MLVHPAGRYSSAVALALFGREDSASRGYFANARPRCDGAVLTVKQIRLRYEKHEGKQATAHLSRQMKIPRGNGASAAQWRANTCQTHSKLKKAHDALNAAGRHSLHACRRTAMMHAVRTLRRFERLWSRLGSSC